MVLVFVLLMLNLMFDIPRRIELEDQRHAQFLSMLISDQMKLAWDYSGDKDPIHWQLLNQRLYDSSLLSTWVIVAASGENLEVKCSSDSRFDLSDAERDRFLRILRDTKTFTENSHTYLMLAPPIQGKKVYLARLGLRADAMITDDLERTIYGVVLILVIGIVLILLNTYVLLNRFVLRPLNHLAEVSSAVAAGDFSKTVPVPAGSDEVARAIHAFNLMTERIREYHARLMQDIQKKGDELRDTQHKLVVAQRLTSTGTLAAGIAHEINNPLSGLINMALTLREKSLDDIRKKEYMDLIIEGLYKIKATVDKILLFAPRPTQIRDVNVREIVQKAVALVEHKLREKGAVSVVRVPESLPHVQADPSELQQVFLNILINSLDAIDHGKGRIEIESQSIEEGVRISVRDNGCGMSDEELSHCFVPFHTTKPQGQGTGLGLPIARSIIESYGGDIYIESEKGKGTSIHVLLPTVVKGVLGK
jgi:two-component system NtrC family sensor kinase